jgi:hypothetical protein
MNKFLICLGMAVLLAAGCKSAPRDERAAMRTAIEAYLSQRGNLNLAGMDMDVQVTRQDERTADVNVVFRAKQGGGSMQMSYQLERQGEGWVVKGSRSGMGGDHPAVGGGATAPSGDMPAAHPPVQSPQPAPATPPKKP